MAIKHMIIVKDLKLWKRIKVAAAMNNIGTSQYIEQAIKEKLAKDDKEINIFLTADFDDEVKL